jgi:glycerol kinase
MDFVPVRAGTSHTFKNPIEVHKSRDVENASLPMAERAEHLPSGVHETDSERMQKWDIGSIDCGTTSSRFLILNGEGLPIASHQIEFENIYPQSG